MPPDAPLVLAFDTAAAHCAAALVSGETVIAARVEDMAKGQAERLMPMLERLLQAAALSWSDLTLLGVGIGPGNFTGIRISVAAARGLALSLGIPAVGVSTLAANAEGLAKPCLSILDARRGMAYAQLAGSGEPPRLLPRPDLIAQYRTADIACVTGFDATEIAGALNVPAATSPLPVAVAIARIAGRTGGRDTSRPAPLYLRKPDAAPGSTPPPAILS